MTATAAISEMARYPCRPMPLTVNPSTPNHGRNSEIRTTMLAPPMTRSAVSSLATSKRYVGADPAGRNWPGAAGPGAAGPPAAGPPAAGPPAAGPVIVGPPAGAGPPGCWPLSAAPQIVQKSWSLLTGLLQFGHIGISLGSAAELTACYCIGARNPCAADRAECHTVRNRVPI